MSEYQNYPSPKFGSHRSLVGETRTMVPSKVLAFKTKSKVPLVFLTLRKPKIVLVLSLKETCKDIVYHSKALSIYWERSTVRELPIHIQVEIVN